MENKSNAGLKTLVVVLTAMILVMSFTFYMYTTQKSDNVITIENRFIDINGDGLADYIQEAEVIINNGETNFIKDQSP